MEPTVMPEDGHTTRVTTVGESSLTNSDEDTKAFYESLPDLRAFVPAVLLGEAEPKANNHSPKSQEKPSDSHEPDQSQSVSQEPVEASREAAVVQEGNNEKAKDKDAKEKEKCKDPEKEKGKDKDAERKIENEKEKLKGLEGTNLDGMLQRLPGCVSRDLIDQLTVEFCYLNSKSSL
ncbi:regulator of nonsense transcripts UPF2-like isoform X2 [Impatiens glandulifera]|uniref:regulator of nonsense transcripts UPF2-like isoform X2 n=1 Tax=Impatiens glandulifera TaxID=253017 RepID=UPI001FB068B9|nr:regulator of nonsense transcripts UPF2-like isoform X2 [Impatiens glandulifera]